MVDAQGNAAPQTDINLCASCHNPNATDILDITKSTQTSGACALSSSPVGAADHAIDFKVLIHAIHASGDPYAYNTTSPIYGTYGNGASGAASSTGGFTICSTHAPAGVRRSRCCIRPAPRWRPQPRQLRGLPPFRHGVPGGSHDREGTTIHANSATSI